MLELIVDVALEVAAKRYGAVRKAFWAVMIFVALVLIVRVIVLP